jgi:hypothetical protein
MGEKSLEDAFELVQVAGTYIEDGAPRTAADRLRQAASILDQIATERESALAAITSS